jgi:hypothetical protein
MLVGIQQMVGKAFAACFVTGLSLVGLAIGSGGLNAGREESSRALEALTWAFISGAILLLSLSLVLGLTFVALMIWSYFHAVDVPRGRWYCTYWPAERKTHITGIEIKVGSSAGRVRVHSKVRFAEDALAEFTGQVDGDGTYGPSFPQQDVDFANDPQEGDLATVTVRATPDWWRGRPASQTQQVAVAITDHRLTVTHAQVHAALSLFNALIGEAQSILDACGRPREKMVGADPMYFQEHCMPRINQFGRHATATITELCPEYLGKFQNVGNVTHNTDVKPAMIQQVEKWLENLGAIEDELRKRL